MSHSDHSEDPAIKFYGKVAEVIGNARAEHEEQFHGETLTVLLDALVTQVDWLLVQHKRELERTRMHEQAAVVEERQVRLDHLLATWLGSQP